ncbi:MAG: DNA helicase RecQ [Eubacteriales bacterium]|nr:DNA helicase RecQ [Eubacteriales bacterium]
MDSKHEVLNRYFGYTEFRGAQEELIDAVLAGRDVLGIMPTGGGKSLCYQIPAIILPGITLVISPLISLMQDQVLALKTAGIPAAYLNSSLSLEQQSLVFRNLRQGRYKILYAAPERLLGEGFLSMAREVPISLVAVDEAHCISQWGQDFRPSYLKIPEFLQQLPKRPVVCAYTATATPAVRRDIQKCLGLQDPLVKVTGFDRPNLRFEVRTPESKRGTLLTLLALRKDKSGIVYCSTRKEVDSVCSFLLDKNFAAARYHAGLPDALRRQNQEDFLYDRKTVMVATNAFGMGIDKSNVSYVIHYNMPQSMESYYQEAGRAGRDGEKAECILLFGKRDIITAKFLIEKSYEESELPDEERETLKQRDMKRLWDMVDYCQTPGCLRQYILSYFGQYNTPKCGNCGNCVPPKKEMPPAEPEEPGRLGTKDITKESQMVLSCVKRITTALGHDSTITMTVLVLRGSKDKRLRENKLDTLSTYGLMNAYSREELREIIAQLVQQGYLNCGSSEILELTPVAANVLFRGQAVTVTMEENALNQRFPQSGTVTADSGLLADLKALWLKLAAKEKVPAFVIFSNATLEDMAKKQPKTMEEFLTVSGVGAVKAQRYGTAFLKELEKHRP